MIEDYLICEVVGVISSKPKIIKQKDDLKMIMFRLNVSTFNERIVIKLFDLDDDKTFEFENSFSLGDKIKAKGVVKCDAFINKERIIKGISIIPQEIELLEKSKINYSVGLKIIKRIE